MKDITIYFKPLGVKLEGTGDLCHEIFSHDENGFPEIKEKGFAIIYVPEYRKDAFEVSGESEEFRKQLYSLNRGDNWDFTIYDLGSILPGKTVEDTYFALSQVVCELVKKEVVPVVIGGSQDLLMACYKGFESLERMINVCAIDSRLDVGEPDTEITSKAYVSHMLMQRPCYLFNYATVGIQRPLNPKSEVELFDKLYFDVCRLGAFNANFKVAEPYLRNSDLISIDFTSIKNGDTDNSVYKNANGFAADQICQIMKYAGVSDKMSCVSILDIHPEQNISSSYLIAQMIWYFADGLSQRVGDFPVGNKLNYTKFHVHMEEFEDDLVFYKSNKSERWWLEVSYPAGESKKYERHHMIPCNQMDYENAMKNIIPNLWWKTLQKLS